MTKLFGRHDTRAGALLLRAAGQTPDGMVDRDGPPSSFGVFLSPRLGRDTAAAASAPTVPHRPYDSAGIGAAAASEERRLGRVDLDRLGEGWLAGARGAAAPGRAEALARRGLELAVCLALGLLAAPLMALVALAVRLDSPGPALYRQARVGRGGRVFTLYKFRSMRADAEPPGAGPVWAAPADPRVTRIGRALRLARLDELPQLANVLRGEMALVGPRPERPEFVERLAAAIPRYRDRACVKPGITGWAQVRHPYGASVEDARDKLAFDLYYVRHRSLALDLRILLATVAVVLTGRGAR